MKEYRTVQEEFWVGKFGDEYIERNKSKEILSRKVAMFSKILDRMPSKPSSCIEFGANIGLNIKALKVLLPAIKTSAVEINEEAVKELEHIKNVEIFHQSILDFANELEKWDLTFICTVLIHINPQELSKVYDVLYKNSRKYILVAEYYNPTPIEVVYRGNTGKLFKRDFAGEIMDRYPDLHLIDYGFVYHKDHVFPGDDITWFLMEKE